MTYYLLSMPRQDYQSAEEVVNSYDLNNKQIKEVWATIDQEWKDTSGRFYAYTVAHRVCATIKRRDET